MRIRYTPFASFARSDLFAEQKALLEQRLEESEVKYKNRESRPEDVARIKKLAELCQEKDAAIKKLGVRACM